jgi:FAD/FMN-containing dehydrogenase
MSDVQETTRATTLVADLARIVGLDHVLADPGLRAGYEVDWSGRYRGEAAAVVRPASADEVAEIVRACRAARVAIVPQGGNTGLVGGGVPRGGAVLLSLRRLTAIEPVDVDGGAVVAAAGATLARVHAAADEAGFAYGVDLAARDTATIGGTIATNAGGIHVFRNGMTRDQVLGVEAVLGDGTRVSRLGAPRKDNTGYALAQLLTGSEGTLGIVTAARLRLLPRRDRRATAFVGLAGVARAITVARELRRRLPALDAVEAILAPALDLAVRHGGDRPLPGGHAAYLLVEAADVRDPEPDLVAALGAIDDIDDAVVATDGPARARLWRLREGLPEDVAREGVPHSIDVALPLPRLAAFVDRLPSIIEASAPGAATFVFGHLLDGNLHVVVNGPDIEDDAVDDAVLGVALEHGGSVSAEHGIGVAKSAWLARDRSAGDLAAMRAIKRALDPDGILNPGVLVGS